jgi:inorganic pyrophosphatase
MEKQQFPPGDSPMVEVCVEIPRGSFLKRGSTGEVDFVSPMPCPYNYGSVREYLGGDGDFLDAIVLGPRLPRGARVRVPARGAVRMSERDVHEDKLVCAQQPVGARERRRLLVFLRRYARCKSVLNTLRGKIGQVRCEGWDDASAAIGRASPARGRSGKLSAGPGPAL